MSDTHDTPRKTRSYTREQRSQAVGLAMSIGVRAAGRRLKIPARNISNWLKRPELRAIVAESRDQVMGALWEAVEVGTREVLAGLKDPDAPLSHKAAALRVVSEQYALLAGEATQRIESTSRNVNVNVAPAEAQPLLTEQDARLIERYLDAVDRGVAITYEEPARLPAEVESDDVG